MTNRQLDILINIILDEVNKDKESIQKRKYDIADAVKSSETYKTISNLLFQIRDIEEEKVMLTQRVQGLSNDVSQLLNEGISDRQRRIYVGYRPAETLQSYVNHCVSKSAVEITAKDIEREIVQLKMQGIKDNMLVEKVTEIFKNK